MSPRSPNGEFKLWTPRPILPSTRPNDASCNARYWRACTLSMDGKSHSTDRRANARRGPADDGPEPDGAMPASIFRSRGRTRAGSRLKIGSFQFHSIPHRMASANFPHDPPFERTQFSMNDVMDPPGRLQYYIYRLAAPGATRRSC